MFAFSFIFSKLSILCFQVQTQKYVDHKNQILCLFSNFFKIENLSKIKVLQGKLPKIQKWLDLCDW